MTRPWLPVAAALVSGLVLGGCASPPLPPEPDPAAVQGPFPAVAPEQAQQVRAEVADRLLAARVAGDPVLVDAAATGPAAELDRLAVQVDGPVADAAAVAPVPATVLVSPQADGWPRWFLAVTEAAAAPTVAEQPPAEPDAGEPDAGEPDAGVAAALPVLELYVGDDVRTPYRSWARMTMLPGAEIPAFAAAEAGSPAFADGTVEPQEGTPSGDEPSVPPAPSGEEDDEEAGLRLAVSGLAARYASVMSDGDASDAAAEFEPDPFVSASLARAQAETAAVAGVASTTVVHEPFGDGEVLYAARTVDGDLLAVTAVQSTTTMTVRRGAGVLRPGPEIRAASGIEETRGTLTTRSVAALAFVVPAEQGAIRLVAVGEGLVTAEAS